MPLSAQEIGARNIHALAGDLHAAEIRINELTREIEARDFKIARLKSENISLRARLQESPPEGETYPCQP